MFSLGLIGEGETEEHGVSGFLTGDGIGEPGEGRQVLRLDSPEAEGADFLEDGRCSEDSGGCYLD